MRRVWFALVCLTALTPLMAQEREFRKPAAPSFMADTAVQVPPIVNPNGIAFTPSADNATVENGVALVTKYTMELFNVTAPTTVVKTVDLGKPTPGTNGEIQWMQMASVRTTLPVGNYTANVYAEGPGGRSAPATSDPFTVAPRTAGATGKPRWIQ